MTTTEARLLAVEVHRLAAQADEHEVPVSGPGPRTEWRYRDAALLASALAEARGRLCAAIAAGEVADPRAAVEAFEDEVRYEARRLAAHAARLARRESAGA